MAFEHEVLDNITISLKRENELLKEQVNELQSKKTTTKTTKKKTVK